MEFGPFRLDCSTKSLYRDGAFVPLTPRAVELLCLLVQAPGRLVTKDEILQRVWSDAHVEDGSIANSIWMLRRVLNPHFEGEGPIATVARRGYRFTAPVRPERMEPMEPLEPLERLDVVAPAAPH